MHKGFTLLELVVVMVIIGILVSLGVPQYITTVERGRATEGISILGAIRGAQLRYYAQYVSYSRPSPACTFSSTENCGLDIGIGSLRFFSNPTTSTSANWLAFIARNSTFNPGFDNYTLGIAEGGGLCCSIPMGSSGNACNRLGITTACP